MIQIDPTACIDQVPGDYLPGFSISVDHIEVFRASFPAEGAMGANEALDSAAALLKEPGFLDELGLTIAMRINQVSGQPVRIIRLEN